MSVELIARVNGWLDFNTGPPQLPEHAKTPDLPSRDEILASLQLTADRWVREIFRYGKLEINGQGRVWRVADISGRAPRKQGSCVIRLDEPDAGSYHEFGAKNGGETGGDAVSTIADHYGLGGEDVYIKAREIAEKYGRIVTRGNNLAARGSRDDDKKARQLAKHIREAQFELSRSGPARGTLAETYLNGRQLQLPDTDNLRFGAETTYWNNQVSYAVPALLAVMRHTDGTLTGGIHRLYLNLDGSSRRDATGRHEKKMLGPAGLVMLAQPNGSGELGIAEGIESSLAAMQLYGVPCWAAASTSGMLSLAGRMREGQVLPGVTKLIVFGDRGKGGEEAATELRGAAIAAGLISEIRFPVGGDDFNDDLVRGLGVGEPSSPQQIILPPAAVDANAILAAARALNKDFEPAELKRAFHMLASSSVDTATFEKITNTIQERTKITKKAIAKCFTEARQELGLETKTVGTTRAASWYGNLRTTDSGAPKATVHNALAALRDAPEWRDILWFDEFRQRVVLRGKAPWMDTAVDVDWTDYFDTKTAEWLQGYDIDCTPAAVTPAIDAIARERTFHPVREYLESLVPDGRKLLDIWLTYFLGAEPEPLDESLTGVEREQDQRRHAAQGTYIRAVGRAWMISAVARIFKPGCKADCALILEGPQGKRKSMALRKLGLPWFADEIAEFGTKDAAIQIQGVWIVELAELSTLRRSDRNRAKSFMSREQDHYVPKYGRRWIDQSRQCVFAGTSNDDEYLNDPTGGRRWWPVKCGEIDTDALELAKDQLWAEAVAAYRAGEIWWLEDETIIAAARKEQAARSVTDVWDDRVYKFLSEQTIKAQAANREVFLTRANILHELGIPDKDQTQAHANRVADCLVRFGWERFQIGKDALRGAWAYRPKKAENKQDER